MDEAELISLASNSSLRSDMQVINFKSVSLQTDGSRTLRRVELDLDSDLFIAPSVIYSITSVSY